MINNRQPAIPSQARTGSLANSGITPKEILDILRRHMFLIIMMTILGAVVGVGLWFVLRKVAPKYTARTYIEVLSPGQSDPTIIGSPLAGKDIAYEFRFSKAALIKQQNMLQELIRRDAIKETRWFKSFNDDIANIIKDLEDNFGAVPDRNSSYILVSMTCGDPKEAALIVNEMVDLFIKSQKTNAETEAGQKLRELGLQENELRDKLRSITTSLDDIRRTTGITQLETGGEGTDFRHTVTQKLASLEVEKTKVEADMEQIKASVANFEERTTVSEVVQRDTENDQVVMQLMERISSYEAELARKQTNLGENHREVQQLRELLRQTIAEKDVRSNAKSQQIRNSDVTLAKDQLALLTNRLAKLQELRDKTENEQRDLDNARSQYDQFVSDREETKTKLFDVQAQISKYNLIKQDAESSKVKAIGPAPEPLEISSPKLLIFAPGGTFLGFMLGIGLAFLIELLNDLIRTPSDVMKFVNIPLLGMVVHKNLDAATKKADMWTVARLLPFSIMSECYRQLKANLRLSAQIDSQKVIFVASGNAEEGRTTVAANMATIFASGDNRVLFIDANFRRPTSHRIFPGSDEIGELDIHNEGLNGYLTGLHSIEQTIRSTGLEGIDVIDSGALPENPAELLGGSKMTELIKYAQGHYDRVIIDGPPMLVSDAKALASQADGTILVFNAAITRRGTAKRIVRELKENNTNILGAVLLGVRLLKGGYFHELFESYREYQVAQKV
ncbi:MAG: polysaccharide biosynthesis tyrosine autokinase [Phycisphaerae bacterium]|jgi:capsular exopolysaccharide synthesis family protein